MWSPSTRIYIDWPPSYTVLKILDSTCAGEPFDWYVNNEKDTRSRTMAISPWEMKGQPKRMSLTLKTLPRNIRQIFALRLNLAIKSNAA
jgi:hypothetical protein